MKIHRALTTIAVAVALVVSCSRPSPITPENVDKVTEGMTYEQVIEILGQPTRAVTEGIGTQTTVDAIWSGQTVQVRMHFAGNKLQSKTL